MYFMFNRDPSGNVRVLTGYLAAVFDVSVTDWKDMDSFTWESYLMTEKAVAVPTRAFKPVSDIAIA